MRSRHLQSLRGDPNFRAAAGRQWPAISEDGAIAQLGERVNGIHEVVGSIPSGSTIFLLISPY